jgi:hypothetical protein
MAITIYKYKLEKTIQELDIPVGGKVLSLQVQDNVPCIWVLVDSNKLKVTRTFETFGTGQTIPPPYVREYIGTFQLLRGNLVYHVFETKEH